MSLDGQDGKWREADELPHVVGDMELNALTSTHALCVSESGEPVRDGGKLLLMPNDDPTGTLVLVEESEEVLNAFGISTQQSCQEECGSPSPTELTTKDCPAQWKEDDAVKYLIHLRHNKLKTLFASTGLSNQRKWEKLARELKEQKMGNKFWDFSWKQCEAKYKDLKKHYNKVKDQLGDRCSGEPPVKKFRFYDDMDEVCSSSPTVNPVATVSSLGSQPSTSAASSCDAQSERSTSPDEKEYNPILKSRETNYKKTRMEAEVKALREAVVEGSQKQEEARERRHKEFLSAYMETMNRLIDKL